MIILGREETNSFSVEWDERVGNVAHVLPISHEVKFEMLEDPFP